MSRGSRGWFRRECPSYLIKVDRRIIRWTNLLRDVWYIYRAANRLIRVFRCWGENRAGCGRSTGSSVPDAPLGPLSEGHLPLTNYLRIPKFGWSEVGFPATGPRKADSRDSNFVRSATFCFLLFFGTLFMQSHGNLR